MIQEFKKIVNSISNPYVEKWKKKGKAIIGYPCTFVPDEIIHAAGILPFRLRGVGTPIGVSTVIFLTGRSRVISYAISPAISPRVSRNSLVSVSLRRNKVSLCVSRGCLSTLSIGQEELRVEHFQR